MGKKSLKEARKISRVYTTEQMRDVLAKNECFTIRKRSVKKRPKKNT